MTHVVRKTLIGLLLALIAEVGLIVSASTLRDHGGLWLIPLAVAGSAGCTSWILYRRLTMPSLLARGMVAFIAGIVLSASALWFALVALISVHGE